MPKHDVGRFSDASYLILASLASGPKHGYAMMEDIREFSGTHLEPGTLYGAISRLEQRGLIEACDSEARRRPYRITASGIQVLKERVEVLERVAHVGKARLRTVER
ncbi:PadR family transcriptional regulator [Alicyclobacillus pomorum]|jgi:DNA-binding PadR family transcriptional regulator|uniref:PadR family transcriptional regulator n=1 Tax=Alicyclobacillus pomorum TaxID=204470 RepID=UPI0003F7D498|nr:PadR family transcriptional regulator [Alicyclobacillus pomorum]